MHAHKARTLPYMCVYECSECDNYYVCTQPYSQAPLNGRHVCTVARLQMPVRGCVHVCVRVYCCFRHYHRQIITEATQALMHAHTIRQHAAHHSIYHDDDYHILYCPAS